MTKRMLSLAAWARAAYGDKAPHISTLRKWVRDGLLYPAPIKHGKQYFISAEAEYSPMPPPSGQRLASRINRS